MALQQLDYREDPVDIPNPDRGPYRGRWQRTNTPFGVTPEVDHRVPVDENSARYHGATLVSDGVVGVVDGDDIEPTEFYGGENMAPRYAGGTNVWATPSIAFLGFDLCNFSSNAFLSRQAGLDFDREREANGGAVSAEMFAGRTGRTGPLTAYALDFIRELLQKVREGDGVALVKFSYDGNGFNYVEGEGEHLIYGPEPTYITPNNPSGVCDLPGYTDMNWIEYHISQLAPIFREYEDVIFCVKTGMLGPWGEQHTSPVAQDPAAYKYLLDAYLEAVPASRALLTHAGGFLAWYNATYGSNYSFFDIDSLPAPERGTPQARFGFFNDSYAAGGEDLSDNGSLSEGGFMLRVDGDPDGYDRYRILSWINRQNSVVQGEGGIGDNAFGRLPGAIVEAARLRTAALNMRHGDYSVWSRFTYNESSVCAPIYFPGSDTPAKAFFDPVYDGRNGLEYMRDRLGYRLVLRQAYADATVRADGGRLRFAGKLQNVGFGNIVNRKRVTAILRAQEGGALYEAQSGIDARDWQAAEDGDGRPDNTAGWRDFGFEIELSAFGSPPPGAYDILLKINDPKEQSANRRCVRFANRGIWDAALGANTVGAVTVTG